MDEKWLQAEAVYGIWNAKRFGDDDVMIEDKTKLHFLRQQIQKAEGQPNMCLSDFISPIVNDYMGAFAVTIKGIEPHIQKFEEAHDDYNKIMLQALADRLQRHLPNVCISKFVPRLGLCPGGSLCQIMI